MAEAFIGNKLPVCGRCGRGTIWPCCTRTPCRRRPRPSSRTRPCVERKPGNGLSLAGQPHPSGQVNSRPIHWVVPGSFKPVTFSDFGSWVRGQPAYRQLGTTDEECNVCAQRYDEPSRGKYLTMVGVRKILLNSSCRHRPRCGNALSQDKSKHHRRRFRCNSHLQVSCEFENIGRPTCNAWYIGR